MRVLRHLLWYCITKRSLELLLKILKSYYGLNKFGYFKANQFKKMRSNLSRSKSCCSADAKVKLSVEKFKCCFVESCNENHVLLNTIYITRFIVAKVTLIFRGKSTHVTSSSPNV